MLTWWMIFSVLASPTIIILFRLLNIPSSIINSATSRNYFLICFAVICLIQVLYTVASRILTWILSIFIWPTCFNRHRFYTICYFFLIKYISFILIWFENNIVIIFFKGWYSYIKISLNLVNFTINYLIKIFNIIRINSLKI